MPDVIKLEEWSVVYQHKNSYMSPEPAKIALHGVADDHPKLGKGVSLTTSSVFKSEGRIVETASGRHYQLGRISGSYAIWLAANNIKLDEAQPVKV